MTLDQLPFGKQGEIVKMRTEKTLSERLLRLNVYVGAKITVVGRSLFGKNYLVESDGVRVGFRKKVAQEIEVLPV